MGLMNFIMMLGREETVTPPPDPEPVDPAPLVIDEDVVTFTGAQTTAGTLAGGHNLYSPRKWWHNGKTYHLYHGIYQSEGLGQGYILVYDDQDGVHRPYRVGNVPGNNSYSGAGDSHTTPSFIVDDNGNLYMFQEKTHDTPIDIYKATAFNNFELLAEKMNPGTGEEAQSSYHNFIKLPNGNGWSWCRMTTLFESYSGGHGASISASNGFEEWGPLVRNTTNPRPVQVYPPSGTGKTRHYPTLPYYRPVVGDYIYCLRTQRVDDYTDSLGIWHKFYIMRTPVGTGRGVIFENLIGTPYTQDVSAANYMDETDLDDNFLFYNSGSAANNAFIPVATCSLAPKVYVVTGEANTGNLLLHIIDVNTRGYSSKSLSIANSVVVDPDAGQSHSVKHIAYIEDEQYLELGIVIDEGTYNKIHLFRSYDEGDTWEDQGDIDPGTSANQEACVFPMNYLDIPRNRNFTIDLYGPDLVTSNTRVTYVKRAAKGTLQIETPRIVVPAVSLSDEFDFFDYAFETGDLTKSGNDITGVTDRFGLRNATGVSNPQWNGSDAFSLNGTSSHFTIPTTGFSDLTKSTFFALVSRTALSNCGILCISDSTNSGSFIQWNLADSNTSSAPNFVHKIPSGAALRDYGQYVTAQNEWVLLGFAIDGRCKVDIYVNGLKQYYGSFNYSTLAHYLKRGTMNYGTINSVRIGMQNLSGTDSFYPLAGKRLVMKNTVYDYETYQSLEKRIANLYGITLNYGYQ